MRFRRWSEGDYKHRAEPIDGATHTSNHRARRTDFGGYENLSWPNELELKYQRQAHIVLAFHGGIFPKNRPRQGDPPPKQNTGIRSLIPVLEN